MPIFNFGGRLTDRTLRARFTLSVIGRKTLHPEKTDNTSAIVTTTNCDLARLMRSKKSDSISITY
jgi:hypothetical protein